MKSRGGRHPSTLVALLVAVLPLSCGRDSATRIDQGREVADRFLAEVAAGRVDPAWQATTVEFKSLMGADSLRDYAKTHPALKAPAEFLEFRPVESPRGRLMEYQFRATPPPIKGKAKGSPIPRMIRVMVDLGDAPPRVERLTSE